MHLHLTQDLLLLIPLLHLSTRLFFLKKHCHETGVWWVVVHQLQRKQIKEQGTISHLKCQAAKSVFKHCNRLWGQEVCSPCQPCESSSLWQQLQETQTAREKVKSSKCFSLEFSQTVLTATTDWDKPLVFFNFFNYLIDNSVDATQLYLSSEINPPTTTFFWLLTRYSPLSP